LRIFNYNHATYYTCVDGYCFTSSKQYVSYFQDDNKFNEKKSINTKQLSKIYINMREGMDQAGHPPLTFACPFMTVPMAEAVRGIQHAP
jgi:hypothetical protein